MRKYRQDRKKRRKQTMSEIRKKKVNEEKRMKRRKKKWKKNKGRGETSVFLLHPPLMSYLPHFSHELGSGCISLSCPRLSVRPLPALLKPILFCHLGFGPVSGGSGGVWLSYLWPCFGTAATRAQHRASLHCRTGNT